MAQVPALSYEGLAAEPLIGEVFCPLVKFSNVDSTPGYGPYYLVTTPPEVEGVSGIDFLDVPIPVEDLGKINNTGVVIDPISQRPVPGVEGGGAFLVRLPVGSVLEGQPALVAEACLRVKEGAELGVPLLVEFLPGFEFGDSPTGDNGPVTGPDIDSESITPQVARLDKEALVAEGERPPGPSHSFDYRFTVDLSDGIQIFNFQLRDTLPPELQWTGDPITVAAAQGILCLRAQQPNAPPVSGGNLNITCVSITGTASEEDLVVTLPVYITDILDETATPTSADPGLDRIINNEAEIAFEYGGVSYDQVDAEVVRAVHVAVHKTVTPWTVAPGEELEFSIRFRVTDYDSDDSLTQLTFSDDLDDGLGFVPGSAELVLDGARVPFPPDAVLSTAAGTRLEWDIASLAGVTVATGARGRVVYRAQVLQVFSDGSPVAAEDVLGNSVNSGFTHSDGASDTNGSRADASVEATVSDKTLLLPAPAPNSFKPGDELTFRLQMDVPSGDTFDVVLTDYLPLPAAFVTDPSTRWSLAPPPFLQKQPAVSTDASNNSIRFDFGTISELTGAAVAVDLTIQITDQPFSDGLFLTNLLEASSTNSAGEVDRQAHATEFRVGAPELRLTQGVYAIDNPAATIVPAPPADPSLALVDSDAVDVDAADQVTIVTTIENIGSKSAFNLLIDAPENPQLQCLELGAADVVNALGTPLNFTGSRLRDGILIDGPLPGNDQVPPAGGAPFADDTILLTQRCILAADVRVGEDILSTARVLYSSTPGSPQRFPESVDDARLTVALPSIAKRRVAVIPNYSGAPDTAHIGELVEYEVVIRLPEGVTPDAQFEDLLDRGLAFVSLNSIDGAPGVSSSEGAFDSAVLANAAFVAESPQTPDLDRRLRIGPGSADFGLGTLTNSNTDNGVDDTLTLRYTTTVINWSGNVSGSEPANLARISYQLPDRRAETRVAAAPIRVVEPVIEVSNRFIPTTADQGAPAAISIQVRHEGGSETDAFQLRLTDLFPFGVRADPSTVITSNCSKEPDGITVTENLLQVLWEFFPLGAECTIEVQTTGQPPLPAGDRVLNCVDTTWESLDDRDPLLPAPPSNPLGAERTGTVADPGGSANNYLRRDCAELKIFGVSLTKFVSDSTQRHTRSDAGVEELAIGEEVTFTLAVTLPEDPVTQLQLTETMPHKAVVMEVVGTKVLPLPADSRLDFSDPLAQFPPLVTVSDDYRGDGLADTVLFDFGGPISNAVDGVVDDRDRIFLEVVGRVVDQPENRSGDEEDNVALVTFGAGIEASDVAAVRLVEPALNLLKQSEQVAVEAGDVVTYELLVEHRLDSRADAFDLLLSEELPAELILVPGSSKVGDICTLPPASGPLESATGLSVEWSSFPLGNQCVIEFQARVSDVAITGSSILNTATLAWRSLDNTVTSSDERNYADRSSWDIKQADSNISKELFASSVPETASEALTIGEEVTFRLNAFFPDGVTLNTTVKDLLPFRNGQLQLLSSRLVSVGRDLSFSEDVRPGDPGIDCIPNCELGGVGFPNVAEWDLGTVTNDPSRETFFGERNGSVVFEVIALVKDRDINQGRPEGSDLLLNEALLEANKLLSGDGASFYLVEPRLALRHRDDQDRQLVPVVAGQTVPVRLTIEHQLDSSSAAFDLTLRYRLDPRASWVADDALSSSCPGIGVDSSAADEVVFSFPSLLLSQRACVIDFPVQLANDLPVPGLYEDRSELLWRSAPDTTEARAGTATRRLEYVAGALARLEKEVLYSSDPLTDIGSGPDALTQLAVGERVSYRLTATIAEGVSQNVELTDLLPASAGAGRLLIQDAAVGFVGANISTTGPGVAQIDKISNTVSFDFGDVTNLADGVTDRDDEIEVYVNARVDDEDEYAPVFANVDGAQLLNEALLRFDLPAPLPPETRSASERVEVVEPVPLLNKSFGSVVAGRVTVDLLLQNDGRAPAYSARISDPFPEDVWQANSMQVVSVPPGFELLQSSAAGVTTVTLRPINETIAVSPEQVLLPGQSLAVSFTMDLLADPASSVLINTATATVSSQPQADPEGRDYTDQASDSLAVPVLDVLKSWSSTDNPVVPGSDILYTVSLVNNGTAAATNLVISDVPDPLGTFVAGSVGSSDPGFTVSTGNSLGDQFIMAAFAEVPAGESYQFSYRVQVPFPYAAGVLQQLTNQAEVTSQELAAVLSDDPATSVADDPTVVPIVADPVMAIRKQALSQIAVAGGTVFYQITYANSGNQNATGVVLRETVPDTNTGSGEVFFSAADSSPGWSCPDGSGAGTSCELSIGPLAAADGGDAIFAVRLDSPLEQSVTAVSNTVVISDDGLNTDPANCLPDCPRTDDDTVAVPVLAAPVLELVKDDGISFAVPGQLVTYTLDVANTGEQDATGVVLTERIGQFVSFDAAASTPGWDCPNGAGPGSICSLDAPELPAGATAQVLFAVRVDPRLPAGAELSRNTASLQDDGSNSGNGAPIFARAVHETPLQASPDLRISKSDGDVDGRPGLLLSYTLDWANGGNQAASNAGITETVPVGSRYAASASLPDLWDCADGDPAGSVCQLSLGTVAAGQQGMARFGVLIDDPLPAGQVDLVNTVRIEDDGSNGADPTPDNNTDTVMTSLNLLPPTGRKRAEDLGEGRIRWTISWFNNANRRDLPIYMLDPLPARQRLVSGSLRCTAEGASQCTQSIYNATERRVEVTGILAPDFGFPDLTPAFLLRNEIVVVFETESSVASTRVRNVAEACWDENNSGSAVDDQQSGQSCIPVTAQLNIAVSVPALGDAGRWLLVMFFLALVVMQLRRVRRG